MQIGPYEVQGELARGGMGVVYRAHDPERGRDVAVKVLLNPEGDKARLRFEREIEALATFEHPNVVTHRGAGVHEGQPYLAMDLVEGESLQERLERDGPLKPREAVLLMCKLADALQHAHAWGVLHRDLKPANIMITPSGSPLLTDFGLARQAENLPFLDVSADGSELPEAARPVSVAGRMLGTPGYWPPEQARGDPEEIGPHSDVYGAGAVLYALLTGVPPIEGESFVEIVVATQERRPDPPSEVRAGIPPALDAICLRCLEKDPEDRYPTIAALADELEACLRLFGRSRLRFLRRFGEGVVGLLGCGVIVALCSAILLIGAITSAFVSFDLFKQPLVALIAMGVGWAVTAAVVYFGGRWALTAVERRFG